MDEIRRAQGLLDCPLTFIYIFLIVKCPVLMTCK